MSARPGSEAVVAAAERFLPGGTVEPVGDRTWLVSVTTDAGRFSVRQLDPRRPAVRVDLIQEFLSQPALENTTRLIAKERQGSQAFDARVWADGETAGRDIIEGEWNALQLPADISIDRLGSIAGALGAFHRTGLNGSILARAPHFKAREALTQVRKQLDLDERRLAGEIRKESRARRWLTAARPLLANAEQALEQAGFLREEPEVIAHLDLWGSHIVSGTGDANTLLDCSSIGAAPAVVDIAQLIARGGSWSDERVERVLQRYSEEFALPPLQRRMLPWLTALDAVAGCGRLLVRAHDERNPLSDRDRRAALAAADLQLEQLTVLAGAFVPPPPRQRRRYGGAKSRD
jgi:hypothetical protein